MASLTYSTVFIALLIIWRTLLSCHAFGTFGFEFHHRFSDPVKGVLTVDELPERGTLHYYTAMAHRDRIIHGRGLASHRDDQQLTFGNGNYTVRLSTLGFLHYANVSVGTPSVSFLVALDTGSDLFWVPCDCTRCIKTLILTSGARLDLNMYSPNASSTSKTVPCNSSSCEHRRRCPGGISSTCPYQVQYLSNDTSSTGILVEDVLHLTTEGRHRKVMDAQITFGCGLVETGSFLDGAAPNGLFGLGMGKSAVPSILSSAGVAANSFSMCFGPDGIGRISFGDKGSPSQDETPFNINKLHPTYNISVTRITVGTNQSNIAFSAIFDSGTSFTYLNDPAYTLISERFDMYTQDARAPSDPAIPFEYCYAISPDKTLVVPNVTLSMKGGKRFLVFDPIIVISDESAVRYCLAVVKSSDVNIIGQNFMTGYNIMFDREKLVLGWKKSNCYGIEESSNIPTKPPPKKNRGAMPPSPAAESPNNTVVPPATAAEPRNDTGEGSRDSGRGSDTSWAPQPFVGLLDCTLLILFLSIIIAAIG